MVYSCFIIAFIRSVSLHAFFVVFLGACLPTIDLHIVVDSQTSLAPT